MIFNNNTLYVDLIGNLTRNDINKIQYKIFNILDQYEVENIIINTRDTINYKKSMFNSMIKEYNKKYRGNMLINTN